MNTKEYFSLEVDADGVQYIRCSDEVLIVPLTAEGEILLIRDYAPARSSTTLILPGGSIDLNETIQDTANRELQEEIGYKSERLDVLQTLHPWPKYLTANSHLVLARDLVPSNLAGDEPYEITIEQVPFDSFEKLIEDGVLQDARAIVALFLARQFVQKNP